MTRLPLALALIASIGIATIVARSDPPTIHGPVSGAPVAEAASIGASGYAPGVVVVKFRRGVQSGGDVAPYRAQAAREIAAGLGAYAISVPAGSEEEIVRRLRADPSVEYASTDFYLELAASFPNDPAYVTDNEANYGPDYRFIHEKPQVPEAWDLARGVSSVTVAIIDTGVDLRQPDLAGRIASGANFIIGEEGRSEQDNVGHGTAAAGIIAATPNNGQYAAGINWRAKVMGIKAFNDQGRARMTEIVGAIRHAGTSGVTIVNMSYVYTTYPAVAEDVAVLTDAVNTFLLARNIITIAAAGNFGSANNPGRMNDALPPGSIPGVIAVAATELSDADFPKFREQISDRSSRGSWVSVTAPGKFVRTLWRTNPPGCVEAPCTTEGTLGYQSGTGTSYATPVVSGVASLIKGCYPTLTTAQVKSLIESSADKIGTDAYVSGRNNTYGYGRVNAFKAMQAADALARTTAALNRSAAAAFRLFLPASVKNRLLDGTC